MDKKTLQKKRMIGFFTSAARQLIEERGIETVNVRDVAALAGYNSATLYNYFGSLDDLLFFASLGAMKPYIHDLPVAVAGSKDAYERYFDIWRCFCWHAFSAPETFYRVFFAPQSHSLNQDIKTYYSLFPEELGDSPDDLRHMLTGNNIVERNRTLLDDCIAEGSMREEDIQAINEMTVFVFKGCLEQVLATANGRNVNDSCEKMMFYLWKVLVAFGAARDM